MTAPHVLNDFEINLMNKVDALSLLVSYLLKKQGINVLGPVQGFIENNDNDDYKGVADQLRLFSADLQNHFGETKAED